MDPHTGEPVAHNPYTGAATDDEYDDDLYETAEADGALNTTQDSDDVIVYGGTTTERSSGGDERQRRMARPRRDDFIDIDTG